MITESIIQEDIIVFIFLKFYFIFKLNVHMPSNRASNYVEQKMIQLLVEIDKSTIIVGDFNTLRNEQIQHAENQ